MGRTQSEIDDDREGDLQNELRTLLDRGLDKHDDRRLVEIIKELAVIAVRQEREST